MRRKKLPKLHSEPPISLITQDIEALVKKTSLDIPVEAIVGLTNTMENDLIAGYNKLLDVEQMIGGVGIHNVNRDEDGILTGNYRPEYRSLFRPIQYVYGFIGDDDLVWSARYIILNSCLHIEKAIKFRFGIPEDDLASLGILLNRSNVKNTLEPSFLDILQELNRVVYRGAKHTVEAIRIDDHRFTPTDALAIYLICRWAGVALLEPTELFDSWERPS